MALSKSSHIKHRDKLGKQVKNGVLASAIVVAGEKLLIKIAKQPILIFGLGMACGVGVYKNRQAIIDGANRTLAFGKNKALEQKEKILDLVAEAREGE